LGTMPIQPETFVPVEDPYGYGSPLGGAYIPSINDPVGTTNTNNGTTDNGTTDNGTTDNGTTDTPTTTPIPPYMGGPLYGVGPDPMLQQQAPTYPLPASEIYPNVITPVEREAVFPSYDTVGIPPISTNPFSEPVNTIQAPPPSPFSQQTILPMNLEGNRRPAPNEIVAYYQGGPVPFQQGIGSFVR